jgi:glycosyltransferase involved in cell wall biosynthesis
MKKEFDLTILVPTLNEELTIKDFIGACKAGAKKLGINCQILIADSSSDKTEEIAKRNGAEVVKVKKRGLGNAYRSAIPFVKSKYIIMGDADLTYDFTNLGPFYTKLLAGYEFVMGNRFKGKIEKNAMPKLHQYFGTPITSFILNSIHRTNFNDIHCGMRAITREAFIRMNLASNSWQYASEMLIKSNHLELRSCEIGINFYKDRNGRVSNLKRIGWWAPWHAGWITIETMFIWGIDQLFYRLGILLYMLGFISNLYLIFAKEEISINGFIPSLHSALLLGLISQIGLQLIFLGTYSKIFYEKKDNLFAFFANFNKSILLSFLIFSIGLAFCIPLVDLYIQNKMSLPILIQKESFESVFGINLILYSITIFSNSLLINLISKIKNVGN